MKSTHWTWIVCAASLLCACAGTHHEPRAAHDEQHETLSKGQLTEVATVLDKRGDAVRAEQYWRLALEEGAEAETVLPQLIAAFIRDRQYRLALQHAEDYLRAHPNAHTLRRLTGALHEALGHYAAAVEQYRVLAEQPSERADIHYVLGEALLRQGISRTEADACFRKYLELDPHGSYAERARAMLLKDAHASLR